MTRVRKTICFPEKLFNRVIKGRGSLTLSAHISNLLEEALNKQISDKK